METSELMGVRWETRSERTPCHAVCLSHGLSPRALCVVCGCGRVECAGRSSAVDRHRPSAIDRHTHETCDDKALQYVCIKTDLSDISHQHARRHSRHRTAPLDRWDRRAGSSSSLDLMHRAPHRCALRTGGERPDGLRAVAVSAEREGRGDEESGPPHRPDQHECSLTRARLSQSSFDFSREVMPKNGTRNQMQGKVGNGFGPRASGGTARLG